jgi:esterase
VYTLDLRNHGDSTKQGVVPHSYELMAGDVARFINEHSLDNVVLAGHSMYHFIVMGAYAGAQKLYCTWR